MTPAGGSSFRTRIRTMHELLQGISEEHSLRSVRPGGWTRKEILGHAIDSALNNHQRFVRAALDGEYTGPSYEQKGWVSMHGYGAMPWATLLQHWRMQNELLAEAVERIPEARLGAQCRVGGDDPVTLRFLVENYLEHLHGHIQQILSE